MERLERVNSAYDLEYDYYRKNLPAIDDSEDTEESKDLYEKIFDSRESFTILGLDSYIILSKKSLEKIAKMIKKYPQEYVLFTQHQVVDEDKLDKMLEKEKDKYEPVIVPEQENENENDVDEDGFKKVENFDKKIKTDIFSVSLWLYLLIVLCSINNLLFFIYIITRTEYGFIFYTIYTLISFVCLMSTGIYGFLKCRWKDFSGYLLKISTSLVPCFGLGGIITYFVSSIKLDFFWIKISTDAVAIIIGIFLVMFLTGIIKGSKIITDADDNVEDIKHGLLNDDEEEP
jgi:hypothetical protein